MTDAQQIEACIADIKAGLCCPRVHGCEQNDGEYCLVRQAFARTGLIADPDDEPSPSPPDGQLEPETKTGFASVNDERAEGSDVETIKRDAYKQGWSDCEDGFIFSVDQIAPPPPIPSSTGGEEDREVAFELAQRILEAATNVCTDPDGGEDDETSVRFTGKEGCDLANALFRLSRPQLVAETVEAREFIENWFAPWGSWKTAWWEMAVSDDVEMTDANALKAVQKLLALRPSSHGEAG